MDWNEIVGALIFTVGALIFTGGMLIAIGLFLMGIGILTNPKWKDGKMTKRPWEEIRREELRKRQDAKLFRDFFWNTSKDGE